MADSAKDQYSKALQKEGMDKKEADRRAARVIERAKGK